MFDIILEKMQKDTTQKFQAEARTVRYYRAVAIVHHLFTLGTGFIAYLMLVLGFLLADKYPKYGAKIAVAALVVAIGVLVASTLLKRDPAFLGVINRVMSKYASKVERARQSNPFFVQSCSALLLLYFPLCMLVIIAILSKSPWIAVSAGSSQMFMDSVKQMVTFTAILLPVQVALFTFMFAQLLGKYSSRIVGALYGAPAILLLWLYPVISLFFLNFACLYGYPESLKGVLAFFFASLNVICLVLTIWVANAGTQVDKVIIYVGNRFSQSVRRRIKRSFSEPARWQQLWALLNRLGLDWRDPDRMILFSPPAKAVAVTNLPLASLFNVANKAIAEGQHEVLVSALIGITNVIASYIEKRASYFGTTDPVISYTIDQMSSLLRASSKSSNEYLITEIVQHVGHGALVSLLIDPLPRKKDPSIEDRMVRGNHPFSGSWIGLLGEAFELSHTLMRSTAASEAINQLAQIALFAFQKGYGDVVFVGYLPKIREMHGICIAKPDPYHLTLAGDCIMKTMGLWSLVTRKYGQWSCRENLNEQIANVILQMAVIQLVVEKLPSYSFHDSTNALTVKIELDRFIIQDIFFITISRDFSEWWEERETINDLKRIIQLVSALTVAAVTSKTTGTRHYTEALYEISYVVLRGLPERYKKVEKEAENAEDAKFHRQIPSVQEILEEEIFNIWSRLFHIFFRAEDHLGLDWERDFFGIIGIGMVCYEDHKRDSLKTSLIRLISEYRDLCRKENANRERGIPEWAWDYLQLLGAWTFGFLHEEDLARAIAKEVAEGRPFHYSIGILGSSSLYGYPEARLHSEFLPWLRNLQPQKYITEQEWDTFRLWQEMLMKKEVLMQYYEIVDEIREPLRDAFYKKMRELEKKKKESREET
jgi:hypothetical protein